MRALDPIIRCQPVNMSLPTNMLQEIEHYAKKLNTSRSTLIRASLYNFLGITVNENDIEEMDKIAHNMKELRELKEIVCNEYITETRK